MVGTSVLHLHGINGALPWRTLKELSSDIHVVVTLHDMNPFTGACHYSLGCERFTESCTGCPAVKPIFRNLVTRNLDTKFEALRAMPRLSVVAPSEWLATQARASHILRDTVINVVHNPVDPVFLEGEISQPHGERPRTFRVVVVAKNLSDPVKQVELAVRAFEAGRPRMTDAQLTLVGSGGREFAGPGIELVGSLGKAELARTLATSDVLIVPSRAENAPLVIGEAAATGCVPLVARVGGMTEMVAALGSGGVFSTPEELTRLLVDHSSRGETSGKNGRDAMREKARQLYSPSAVVREYDKVYAGS
jgi:glycosyltransferase involved in cell wall biosynthesis